MDRASTSVGFAHLVQAHISLRQVFLSDSCFFQDRQNFFCDSEKCRILWWEFSCRCAILVWRTIFFDHTVTIFSFIAVSSLALTCEFRFTIFRSHFWVCTFGLKPSEVQATYVRKYGILEFPKNSYKIRLLCGATTKRFCAIFSNFSSRVFSRFQNYEVF